MSSILTNMAAMSAVQNLAATQKSLADVQNEISTGLSISSAKDNAAYYSIAQGLRTNVSNLSAVSSSLNLGTSVLSTATAATNNIYSVLQSISKDLVSAAQPGNDLASLQTSINTLRQQLGTTVATASFNGVNLLDGSNPTSVSFVSGVTGSGAGTTVNQLSIATAQTNLSGAGYQTGTNVAANTALTTVNAAATLAAQSNYNALSSKVASQLATLTAAAVPATTAVLAGANATLSAVFGSTAAMDNTGHVTGISSTSAFAQLFGASATMTLTAPTGSNTINNFAVTGTVGGAANAYTGAAAANVTVTTGASSVTISTAVQTGSVAAGVNTAVSNLTGNAATYSTFLVDNAVKTQNAKMAALNTYNTDLGTFQAAVAKLSTSDLANGSTSAALQSVFGTGATVAGGVVTGMTSSSMAGTLMGTGGSYTVSNGSFTTSGTDQGSGGDLWALYGSYSGSSTTDATATGGASWTAAQAAAAVNGNVGASNTYNGGLFQISQINLTGATPAQIADYTSKVNAALKGITNTQEVLGAASSNLDLQSTYTSTLSDSLTTGVGSLVDADMNEASTRLNALQTQQQLGVQALSVANQNSQLILKLFQ